MMLAPTPRWWAQITELQRTVHTGVKKPVIHGLSSFVRSGVDDKLIVGSGKSEILQCQGNATAELPWRLHFALFDPQIGL